MFFRAQHLGARSRVSRRRRRRARCIMVRHRPIHQFIFPPALAKKLIRMEAWVCR